MMPDLDGFTVVAALHDDATTRDVPVLILTSHDITDADKARLSGKIVGVAAKDPTAPATVLGWVDAIIHREKHTLATATR
jgi:CheY-like chemotaxis protein